MRRAFTLIELLVVVVIIAILASVALTAFRAVKNRANRAAGMSTMRTLGTTIAAYIGDNNGNYPGAVGGEPALAAQQTASVDDEAQLCYYLSEPLWGDSLTDAQKEEAKVLIEFVPLVARPFVRKPSGENRPIYLLYHVSTDEEDPEPGLGSIDPSTSVWGRKAASIAYDKGAVPMLSDLYLSNAWQDYKDEQKQTFWGDSFNVLFFDGHGETIKAKDYSWIEAVPGGGGGE